jgi:hypothetical protein
MTHHSTSLVFIVTCDGGETLILEVEADILTVSELLGHCNYTRVCQSEP